MLRSTNKLHGCAIHATDGELGKVDEFFFDEKNWTVRYVVVDTGTWLTGRCVLLSPAVLGQPDWDRHSLPVSLTKKQVELSPDIDTDQPISRQQEEELRRYFGWANYGVGDPLLADPTFATGPMGMSPATMAAMAPAHTPEAHGDPDLESTKDVVGCHIQATGGEVGHVEDFIVDDHAWVVRYIVVDTRNFLPGKKVLISPAWVEKVDWAEGKVRVNLSRERIRHSPPYNPSAPIDRDYESRLYDYYQRPKYWP